MATDWQNWWKAYQRKNKNAKMSDPAVQKKWREWQSRRDPGEGGPGAGRVPGLSPDGTAPATPPSGGGGGGGGTDGGGGGGSPTTTPQPPPTNLDYEKAIKALEDRLNNLQTLYNTKRSDLYSGTRDQLLTQGYFDTLDKVENAQTTNSGGNVSYKFSYGPDGRLYRQAYMTNTNNLAARGMASGSVLEAAQRQARDSIDSQRSTALTGYQKAVDQATSDQGTELSGVTDKLRDTRVDYAAWQKDQSVAPPSAVDPNAAANSGASNTVGAGTTPTDTTGTTTTTTRRSNPNILGRGATRSAAVTQARKAVPGVKLEIRQRGGGKGYVAVRKPKR